MSPAMLLVCAVLALRWYGLSVYPLELLRAQWLQAVHAAAHNYHEFHAINAGEGDWGDWVPDEREAQVSYRSSTVQQALTEILPQL